MITEQHKREAPAAVAGASGDESSRRPTHGYCPSCREDSAIGFDETCLWCGGPTEQRDVKKRGGWRRPDIAGSRYTEPQLRALHLMHTKGASINNLAKQSYEKVGYRTHASAAVAISREWKRMGLPVRDRIEQVRKTCTTHGLAPKHGPRPGYGPYKRKVLRGQEDQPACAGVRTQHPRKGEPCDRPAMYGSEYCFVHDPALHDEVVEIAAKMRERQPEVEMVPLAPFATWLRARHAELGGWEAVADRMGRSTSLIHCYAREINTATKQPKTEIGRDLVADLLDTYGGATFTDLYEPAEVAA